MVQQATDPWNTQMGYAPTDLMAGLYPWATYIPNLAYNLTALQTGEAGSNYRAQLDAQSRIRIASMQAGGSRQAAARTGRASRPRWLSPTPVRAAIQNGWPCSSRPSSAWPTTRPLTPRRALTPASPPRTPAPRP